METLLVGPPVRVLAPGDVVEAAVSPNGVLFRPMPTEGDLGPDELAPPDDLSLPAEIHSE
jgi:hypothetical protein